MALYLFGSAPRGHAFLCWSKEKVERKDLFKNYDYTALRRLFSSSVNMIIFDPFKVLMIFMLVVYLLHLLRKILQTYSMALFFFFRINYQITPLY